MTDALTVAGEGIRSPDGDVTQSLGGAVSVRRRVDPSSTAVQSTTPATTSSSALLVTAIRSIPIGVCAWGPKVLLEHLAHEAAAHGEPADHVATTHPELADALGCNPVTASDLLDVLVRLELVTVERRLFRGEQDERAPQLSDGGTILRLHPARIYRLARRNEGPIGHRYRPASESAIAQHAARQRELEEELVRLRGSTADRIERLERQLEAVLKSSTQPATTAVSPDPTPAPEQAATSMAASTKRRRRVVEAVVSGAPAVPSTRQQVAGATGGRRTLSIAGKGQCAVLCITQTEALTSLPAAA